MKREEIREFHYIAHVDDVPSIVIRGIYCYHRAASVGHQDFSDPEVQVRRERKQVTLTRGLHDYANLYISAHNATLSKIRNKHEELCVLRIRPAAADLPGVVVSDRNAAADGARFCPAPRGFTFVDKKIVFAIRWKDRDDPGGWEERKQRRSAEVLVPDRVPGTFIFGAYVSIECNRRRLLRTTPGLDVTVHPAFFFLEPG